MGVFLQVMGGLAIAGGVIAALLSLAVANSLSPTAGIIGAVIWFASSLVSGCVLIALGQMYDRVMEIWTWMRAQQRDRTALRPSAREDHEAQPDVAAPSTDGETAPAPGSANSALWAKYGPAIEQAAAKKD